MITAIEGNVLILDDTHCSKPLFLLLFLSRVDSMG